jgi:hypothetical protein
MTRAAQARRRQRARAARQALTLCEAEPLRSACGVALASASPEPINRAPRRTSPAAARAALRAVGLPPHVAAKLRSRLRLSPEQEATHDTSPR